MSQKTMKSKKGKSFGTRVIVQDVVTNGERVVVQGNQWQATQRQQDWLKYYMDPDEKETWGNAYQSALKAGYSENYASKILSEKLALEWVRQARNIMRLNPEHLKSALNGIISGKYSKDADKIAAIKLLGTEQGMFIQKQITAHVGIEEALRELEEL